MKMTFLRERNHAVHGLFWFMTGSSTVFYDQLVIQSANSGPER